MARRRSALWPLIRKSWLFAGSDRGGQRAAVMYSLIVTAKMNNVDPQAWLADVLARIAEHPARKLDEPLPWNWQPRRCCTVKRPDLGRHQSRYTAENPTAAAHILQVALPAALTACLGP
jgi:IS66 C-terminal element